MNALLKSVMLLLALAWALPAQTATTLWVTPLSGSVEAPPNDSAGFGTSILIIDTTALTYQVIVAFAGLTGTTTVAHIHCCTATPGVAPVGVATPTPTFPGFPVDVTAGAFDGTFDATLASSWNAAFINNNGGTPEAAFAALQAGLAEGRAYLNVHTTAFPGGEIAGFYVLVPVPAAVWLFASGLMVVGVLRRQRRRGI